MTFSICALSSCWTFVIFINHLNSRQNLPLHLYYHFSILHYVKLNKIKKKIIITPSCVSKNAWSGVRTHAPEENSTLNCRLRPLGHPCLTYTFIFLLTSRHFYYTSYHALLIIHICQKGLRRESNPGHLYPKQVFYHWTTEPFCIFPFLFIYFLCSFMCTSSTLNLSFVSF